MASLPTPSPRLLDRTFPSPQHPWLWGPGQLLRLQKGFMLKEWPLLKQETSSFQQLHLLFVQNQPGGARGRSSIAVQGQGRLHLANGLILAGRA